MNKDLLLLLRTDFVDPDYPGKIFYCRHCVLLEGLLALYPRLADRIDVERVPWPRPRQRVVDLIGEDNQSLPVLILRGDDRAELATGHHRATSFIHDLPDILHALSSRHGIAFPHP